jgi:hypothetical protein
MGSSRTEEIEARARGEVPAPRSGRSYDELLEAASKDEVRAFLVKSKERAERSRIGIRGSLLAHYTCAATCFDHILPTRKLRLSAFALMSDPRENKDWVRYAVNRQVRTSGRPQEVLKAMSEPFPVDLNQATQSANAMRQQGTKILALTAESSERSPLEDFKRAYAKPRMWERYGDSHRGVCLVFDRDELHRRCVAQLETIGTTWNRDVVYDNGALVDGGIQGFRLDGAAIAAAGGGDVAKGLAAHLQENYQLLFFTKMEDYRDEQEYRYVVFDGSQEDYVHVDLGDALVAVVLAEAFPESGREDAGAMCMDQGVAIRVMEWRDILPCAVPLDLISE